MDVNASFCTIAGHGVEEPRGVGGADGSPE